ncbi:MAG: Ig-like domain-containing protein [Pseudobutyrivibrio sp.]|nr:Ig-like domain-containing protein [Pseudobutyrivibrio sp.]
MKNRFRYLKSIFAFTLAVITGVTLFVMPVEAASKKKSSGATYAEGDDIAFGNLDGAKLHWTILTYDDSTKTAFVVSRNSMASTSVIKYQQAIGEQIKKSKKPVGYVRWSENYWRAFCNLMYKNCFTKEERSKIKKTTHSSEDEKNSVLNLYHDTTNDAEYLNSKVKSSLIMDVYDTQTMSSDYLFFLSSDEYITYKDTMKYESNRVWPLRTNFYGDTNCGCVVKDSDKLIYKANYYYGDGIRPAMYVTLGDPEEESTEDTKTDTKTDSKADTATKATQTTTNTNAKTNDSGKATTKTTTSKKKGSYANNGTNTGNLTLPDDSAYSMRAGGTAQVAIDMEYLNNTDKEYTVTYKSSDASVFTVDNTGKITAADVGTATLTVRMKKSNGKVYTMSCRIDVT